jgi:hypothetical protein
MSGYKVRNSDESRRGIWHCTLVRIKSIVILVTAGFLLTMLTSCATQKTAGMPSHKGLALDNALAQFRQISSISTVAGLEYEKNDTIMSGDASLSASPDKLSLRIYYLGFLQGEVYEENGVIKSKPKLDKKKSAILVDGLKNSLFWWNISDYKTVETADSYELRNTNRKVVISKETLLPVEQTIEMPNGDVLTISYAAPMRIVPDDGKEISGASPLSWYQSMIRIQLKNYIVRVNVKSYSVTR